MYSHRRFVHRQTVPVSLSELLVNYGRKALNGSTYKLSDVLLLLLLMPLLHVAAIAV